MKATLLIVVQLLFINAVFAQINLVPIGSIEQYSNCPVFISNINEALGWSASRESPDYFNASNNSVLGVPVNEFGHQSALDGNAYIGLISYCKSQPNIREHAGIQSKQADYTMYKSMDDLRYAPCILIVMAREFMIHQL